MQGPGCCWLSVAGSMPNPPPLLPNLRNDPPPSPSPCPPSCSCFNWIDRKVNYSRWLTLDCVEQRPIYGNAAKLTSSGSPGITAWGSGLPAVTKLPAGLDGSNHAGSTHAPRQLQYPGSPGTYYRSSPSGSSSPQRAKRSPLGSPTLVQAQLWGGGSPTSHAMLRSGSGMPDSPLIGARR